MEICETTNQTTMKNKKNKANSLQDSSSESSNEGIVNMLISLHTFPLESEEELRLKQEVIEKIKLENELNNSN